MQQNNSRVQHTLPGIGLPGSYPGTRPRVEAQGRVSGGPQLTGRDIKAWCLVNQVAVEGRGLELQYPASKTVLLYIECYLAGGVGVLREDGKY